jgi:hypothetical protein
MSPPAAARSATDTVVAASSTRSTSATLFPCSRDFRTEDRQALFSVAPIHLNDHRA